MHIILFGGCVMNYEEFKEKFKIFCDVLGGKFTKESYGGEGLEVLTCAEIPRGRHLGVDILGSKLSLTLHGETIDIDGLRRSSVTFKDAEEAWFGQDYGVGNGHVSIDDVEFVRVTYNKRNKSAHVDVYPH